MINGNSCSNFDLLIMIRIKLSKEFGKQLKKNQSKKNPIIFSAK